MNPFDRLRSVVFSTVHKALSGCVATWTPNAGGESVTANVFFVDPSEELGFGASGGRAKGFASFEPDNPSIEYLRGTLNGLKESVDAKVKEILVIDGVNYRVTKVIKKGDGHVFIASLNQLT